MLIKVRVESTFHAPANGTLKISIDTSRTVQSIIDQYCQEKGISVDPNFQLTNRVNLPLSGKRLIEYYDIRNGDSLYLTNKGEFKTFRFTNWFALSALAVFLGIAGIAICVSVYMLMRDIPDSYAIVFDAGSTHTDTILFKWPGSKINNTGLVTEVHGCTVTDGIADVPPTANNISNYLSKCLQETRDYVHPDSNDYTEVFFGATAGMRLLQETNPEGAIETMAEVVKFLHSSGLEFEDSQAQIIHGVTEGVSAWITVNYLHRALQSGVYKYTRGALDLGGASTQIAFQVDEAIGIGNPHVQQVQLYGRKFHVFCQSFLCYGTVQVLYRYRALLIKSNGGGSANISSPCDPIGYQVQVSIADIMSSPCTPNSVSILYHLDSLVKNQRESITFVGTGDYEKCRSNISYLLSPQFCRDMNIGGDKCLDVSQIPDGYQHNMFTGMSGFAYSRFNLNLTNEATKDEYLARTKYHCNLTFDELTYSVAIDKSKKLKNQLELCYKAVYVHTLLSEVYKFSNNRLWANIEFQNRIENKTFGWALGYMVNATESISTIPSVPTFDTVAFILLVILFVVFVFIGAAFFFRAVKFRKADRYNEINQRPVLSNC